MGRLTTGIQKKLNILTFAYLPFLLFIALILSVLIANFIQLRIDVKGILLVVLCFLTLYLICLLSAYKKARSISQKAKNNRGSSPD